MLQTKELSLEWFDTEEKNVKIVMKVLERHKECLYSDF